MTMLDSPVLHFNGKKKRAGGFTVFLLSCGCWLSVYLPHDAVGWSAVCYCGNSWSYSLTFCANDITLIGLCSNYLWDLLQILWFYK